MTTATPTRPLPECIAPEPTAPRCGHCAGTGVLDDDDFGAYPCFGCDGTGAGSWVEPCEFTLNVTRTHRKPGQRRCRFDPNTGRLALTRGKKVAWYSVREIEGVAPEFGRGFELVKDDGGEVYEFQCGPAGVTCSCSGETYQSSAKANQRAWETGDEVYPTYGCIHADSCVPLLKAGYFDLNASVLASVT